jgi:hypothetical protein
MSETPRTRREKSAISVDVAAASPQSTLAEIARMIQVGVVPGPAVRFKAELVALFRGA